MASHVFASPFLVCAPPESGGSVNYYEIEGLPEPFTGRDIPTAPTGTYGFKLDLSDLPAGGPWPIRARACSVFLGCSEDSAIFFLFRPAEIEKITGTLQLIK